MADEITGRFTKKHPRFGVRVRVASPQDLTGQEVTVIRKDETTSRVKLTKRIHAMDTDAGWPALYEFENPGGHPKFPKVADLETDELSTIVSRSPRSWEDKTSREKAAFRELAKRVTQVAAA